MYSSGSKFVPSLVLPTFQTAPLFEAVRIGILSSVRKLLLLKGGMREGCRVSRGGVGLVQTHLECWSLTRLIKRLADMSIVASLIGSFAFRTPCPILMNFTSQMQFFMLVPNMIFIFWRIFFRFIFIFPLLGQVRLDQFDFDANYMTNAVFHADSKYALCF